MLPCERVIRMFHRELMRYFTDPDALFITRQVKGQERRKKVDTRDGTRLLPSDNAPAWWWHKQLFDGVAVSRESFADSVKATPVHMFDVRGDTLNTAGWHAAHILDAKDGNVDWRSWTRAEAALRFARNVHPLNLFYVPKADWQRVGGDAELIGYIASVYAARWPEIWAEFTAVAGEPALRPDAGDRILRIARAGGCPSGETLDPPAGRRDNRHAAARPGDAAPWNFVLGARRPKPITRILCRHPDADGRRRRLVEGLTLERFVALGNALYNYTRERDLKALAPGDPVRQAEIAFDRLEKRMEQSPKWIARQRDQPSRWTVALGSLRQGADEGLQAVLRLDLCGLITAALRVVDGPYRKATDGRRR